MTAETVAELMELFPQSWLAVLERDYKIRCVVDGDLVSLKYDQRESPMHEPIVRQCRGMVVHYPTRTILAHPYNKFWNHGEPLAAMIDWSTARMLDKFDGSLMTLYWTPHDGDEPSDTLARGAWRVASSGHPTAGGPFGDSKYTFAEAFWEAFGDNHMLRPHGDLASLCFMFELVGPDNRIVVKYPMPWIVLHGARDLDTGEEIPRWVLADIAKEHNWPIVDQHPVSSVDEVLAAAAALDPMAHEGFVVVDAMHRRIKVKSPRYVAIHHMKGEMTTRRAIELWQTGEESEVLAHFPEMRAEVTPVHQALEYACAQALAAYQHLRGLPRKEYAAAVKDRPWSAIAFRLLTPTLDEIDLDYARRAGRGLSTSALERIVEQEGA